MPAYAVADDAPVVYWYTDAKGALSQSTRLEALPAPWLAMYRFRRVRDARSPAAATRPAPMPAPLAPNTDAQMAQREFYRQTVEHWRDELYDAVLTLRDASEAHESVALNVALTGMPGGRPNENTEATARAADAARARVLAARTMLMETLPKRARDEHVPPAWLD